jgi:hypothetical protein
VSYLRTIAARHVPDAVLPWTSHVVCHCARHRSVRDLIATGGPAGALRAVAPLLLPLRMLCWSDSLPSARDLEAAVAGALADAAASASAARATLAAPPPAPPGVAELRALGVGEAPHGGFPLPPPAPPAPPAQPRAGQPARTAVQAQAQGAPLVSAAVPLNAFCFSPEVRPGASALARSRARLAIPGTDADPRQDAAQRAALARAASAQRRLATRLPLWLVHGEGGRCGGGLRDVAAELPLPVFGLELGPGALGAGPSDGSGEGRADGTATAAGGVASMQQLAAWCAGRRAGDGSFWGAAAWPLNPAVLIPPGCTAAKPDRTRGRRCKPPLPPLPARSHLETLLALQPHGPHVLVGVGPFSCQLATAIACELERLPAGPAGHGRSPVAVILVDGAPAAPGPHGAPPEGAPPPPRLLPLAHAYGLFALCLEAGALPPPGGPPPAPGALWGGFAAEFGAALAAALAEAGEAGAEAGGGASGGAPAGLAAPGGNLTEAQLAAADAALLRVAARRRPRSAGPEWDARLGSVRRAAALAARLAEGYRSPEFVFQGAPPGRWDALCWSPVAGASAAPPDARPSPTPPNSAEPHPALLCPRRATCPGPAVLVVSEEDDAGCALVEASKEFCAGPLSLLAPPRGLCRHGEALVSRAATEALAALVGEALSELLVLV